MGNGRTLVIGVGSTLRGDDGVGVWVVQELARQQLPEGVEVLDGGLEGVDLVFRFEGAERVILIDAADMGCKPGEARVFNAEALGGGLQARFSSTHGFGIREAVEFSRLIGVPPVITVVGIQPQDLSLGKGLSETLARRLREYVELTKGLLASDAEHTQASSTQAKE
ncbi:MAG: hydrogenase maturation protease [Candidatus Zipacnadales bacterium]